MRRISGQNLAPQGDDRQLVWIFVGANLHLFLLPGRHTPLLFFLERGQGDFCFSLGLKFLLLLLFANMDLAQFHGSPYFLKVQTGYLM